MWSFSFVISLVFCVVPLLSSEANLDVLEEEIFLQLLNDEKYVIVLLSDEEHCTGKCETLESLLLSVREDLVEDTGGWVIRSFAPKFKEDMGFVGSTIVFIREGRPLVYSSDSKDEDKLLNYLIMNKASSVHNLTDANFEHETQAGTGATTGDWLVMFTRQDCGECLKLTPVLEAVSVRLKGVKNVAFVEREYGAVTARRFGVKSFPSFVLFRLGKIYRYDFHFKDVGHLTSFAEETFRNVRGEDVPPPKSPFDDVTEAAADWIKENPGNFLMSAGGVFLAVTIIFLLNRPPPESWTNKSKKKKN